MQIRDQALETADEVQEKAQEYRQTLADVTQWAEEMVAKTEPEAVSGGKLGIDSGGGTGINQGWLRSRVGLETALTRARMVLEK
jgi:hypothetical protein